MGRKSGTNFTQTLSESAAVQADLFELYPQILSESVTIQGDITTALVTPSQAFSQELDESAATLDQLFKDVALLSVLQELATTLDQLTKDVSLLSTLQEAATTIDQLAKDIAILSALQESAATLDERSFGVALLSALQETATILAELFELHDQTLSETVATLDAVTTTLTSVGNNFSKELDEAATVLAEITKDVALLSSLQETAATLDQAVKDTALFSPLQETVLSSADLSFLYNPTLSEGVTTLAELSTVYTKGGGGGAKQVILIID